MKLKKTKLLILSLVLTVIAATVPMAAYGNTEVRYLGEGEYYETSETIQYDTKSVESYVIQSAVPGFINADATKKNGCAPLAGTIVAGYYDRWFDELISGYTVGRSFGNFYMYYSQNSNDQIQSAFDKLYTLMETNVGSAGTTENQFKNGLTAYVKSKNLNINIQSIGSGTNIDMRSLDNLLRQNKIGVMCCSKYNFITNLSDNGNAVNLTIKQSDFAHMIVIYGYSVYKYYRNGVNFQTDTYIDCVSTTNFAEFYKVKLNGYMQLDDFIMIDIN